MSVTAIPDVQHRPPARTEHALLDDHPVDTCAYYGTQTLRATTGRSVPGLVTARGLLRQAQVDDVLRPEVFIPSQRLEQTAEVRDV
jgi:aspartate ammonia-lyase